MQFVVGLMVCFALDGGQTSSLWVHCGSSGPQVEFGLGGFKGREFGRLSCV